MDEFHEEGLIHRDLKTDNILIDGDSKSEYKNLVICDLGLARTIDPNNKSMTECGTAGFAPPQIFKDGKLIYGNKFDVFSYAYVAFEVLTRRPIHLEFKAKGSDEIQKSIDNNVRPSFPCDPPIPIQLKKLLNDCWMMEENSRPGFKLILSVLEKVAKEKGIDLVYMKTNMKFTTKMVKKMKITMKVMKKMNKLNKNYSNFHHIIKYQQQKQQQKKQQK